MQLYVQVATMLRDQIIDGQLPLGAMLPSENQMVAEFEVSRETGRRAIAILRAEGLVETKKSRGTYVVQVPERQKVQAVPGSTITTRLPTPAERREMGLGEGVSVLRVEQPDGSVRLYDASRTAIEVTF
jgi:GntR family transcriptional regulator